MSNNTKQILYQIEELLENAYISDSAFKDVRANYRKIRKEATPHDGSKETLNSLEEQFNSLEYRYTKQIDETENLLDTIALLEESSRAQPEWKNTLGVVIAELSRSVLVSANERLKERIESLSQQLKADQSKIDPQEIANTVKSAIADNRKLATIILKNLPEEYAVDEDISKVAALNDAKYKKELDTHRYEQKRAHFLSRNNYIKDLLKNEQIDWFEIDKSYKRLQSQWQTFLTESENVDDEIKASFIESSDEINKVLEPIRVEEQQRREGYISELAALLDDEGSLKKAAQLAREYTKNWKPKASLQVAEEQALWGRFKPLCDEIYERSNKKRAEFLEKLKANHQEALNLLESIKTTIEDQDVSEDDRIIKIGELREKWFANKPLPNNEADALFAQFKELTAAYYKPKRQNDKRGNASKRGGAPKNATKENAHKGSTKGSRKNKLKELWSSIDNQLKANLENIEPEKANIKISGDPIIFDSVSSALLELELIAGISPSNNDANAQKRKLERLQLSLSGKLPRPINEAESIIAGFTNYTPASKEEIDQWGEVICSSLAKIE